MDAEKLFQKALKRYDHGASQIEELCGVVQTVLPDYSLPLALEYYDFLLQCILLRQSLADGVMDENELAFIRGIVSKGDILEEVKGKLKGSVEESALAAYNWENVYELPTLVQAQLITELTDFAKSYIDALALFSAVADAVTRKNYYRVLTSDICAIIAYFAKIDGKKDTDEINEGSVAYVELFAKQYLVIKQFVEDCLKEGKAIAKEVEKDIKLFDKKLEKFLSRADEKELQRAFDELEDYFASSIGDALKEE